ncbi:hypothetical protein JCM19239_2491 [Vibrio variabilis]|uniref:Uncharacterized protein n=1 Tax=Vibrio variabilis TaxID=990271 RepID=A0ABQ0JFI9_9VIBR|nr:hypothetical protein JCM19239_2491 [Vibrio variabilis]
MDSENQYFIKAAELYGYGDTISGDRLFKLCVLCLSNREKAADEETKQFAQTAIKNIIEQRKREDYIALSDTLLEQVKS